MRHRRREERRLPAARGAPEDVRDVRQEADVQHLVRLVEDGQPHLPQRERAAPQVVLDPPRRADDDLRPLLQRTEVALEGVTAEQPDGAHPEGFREVGEHGEHLLSQFARGHEHEALHVASLGVEHIGHRDAEGKRLAGARLGDADDVAAREQHRNRALLHGRRLAEAHARDRDEAALRDAEGGERLRQFEVAGDLGLGRVVVVGLRVLGLAQRAAVGRGRAALVAAAIAPASAAPPAAAAARRACLVACLAVRDCGRGGLRLDRVEAEIVGGLGRGVLVRVFIVEDRQIALAGDEHSPRGARAGRGASPAGQDRAVAALGGGPESHVLGQRRVEICAPPVASVVAVVALVAPSRAVVASAAVAVASAALRARRGRCLCCRGCDGSSVLWVLLLGLGVVGVAAAIAAASAAPSAPATRALARCVLGRWRSA